MKKLYPNGFVVYSELYYDESGIPLDKNCQGGFAWIIKREDLEPNTLFPHKNQIRTLCDLEILKKYIEECEINEIPTNIHFIFSPIYADLIDNQTEFKILKISTFLGYDYVSPDMDFSAVYEAINTNIYDDINPTFTNITKTKINKNGFFNNLDDLDVFIKERQNIINNSCQDIALDKINIILRINFSQISTNEFFPAQVWKVDINKLYSFLQGEDN